VEPRRAGLPLLDFPDPKKAIAFQDPASNSGDERGSESRSAPATENSVRIGQADDRGAERSSEPSVREEARSRASLCSLLCDRRSQRSILQASAIVGVFPSLWQTQQSAPREGEAAVDRVRGRGTELREQLLANCVVLLALSGRGLAQSLRPRRGRNAGGCLRGGSRSERVTPSQTTRFHIRK